MSEEKGCLESIGGSYMKPQNNPLTSWIDDEYTEVPDSPGPVDDAIAETIADELFVHAVLEDRVQRNNEKEINNIYNVLNLISKDVPTPSRSAKPPTGLARNTQFVVVTSALSLTIALLVMFYFVSPYQNANAAMVSLQKVLKATREPLDRTYVIRLLEEYSREKKPQRLSQEAWNVESVEDVDGALLFVRGVDQFVLRIPLRSGEMRTLGCDGETSWAFRDNGPVHVSNNLNRFRGALPGQQQDLPLINIFEHVNQLQNGYDITLEEYAGFLKGGVTLAKISGVRNSRDVRGPKQIELFFNSETGVLHTIRLDGLPRGRGGPKSVLFELKDQSDLGKAFFSHISHHDGQKEIREEGSRQ